MTDRVFEAFAPLYWAAGLPVIPLRQRNKMPDIMQWSQFGSRMPSDSEQAHWLASYPKGNIGLPLGPVSGLCMIDIDTEDEALIEAILASLPKSPWKRVGKKGMGLAYKFEGQKNFKLRGPDGGMILEFLGLGNQMVMPPSIHPETGQPYVANDNLWDVLDQVPFLGEDIEDKLRALLPQHGFEVGAGGRSAPMDIVPAGERDVQMVRHAGYLSRVVLGIDKSKTYSLYEAIQQIYTWVDDFTAKVSGDAMDPQKGVAKLLEFLLKDLEKGRTMPEGWDAGMPDEWREHPTIKKLLELNTAQRWDISRARDWLSGKIAENPSDINWVITRVHELISEVAKDENFSEFEFRALIGFITAITGKDMPIKKSDLLKAYNDAKKGDASGNEPENHAQIARAALEEMQKAGEIRYDHSQFWQWNGSCFKHLATEDIYMFIANTVQDSMIARTHHGYKQVVEVLERMCRGQLIQSEERGVNFANGFVGEDLRIQEHDPKFGQTFTLPFEYERDKASRCNRFLELLQYSWGHEPDFADRVAALQEAFAVTLFGIAPKYQRAFLLYGRAGTGKTQIMKILRALLPPDAVGALGPDKWAERFAMVDLVGKRANLVGELPENGMITGNVFKEVVEGSPVRSEFKGRDGFTFTADCAHWFASNYLPVSRDTTRGFIRRWLMLDFTRVVPEAEQVEDLAEQIVAEEREAIAAWALEGLRRVLDKRGYTLPASHEVRVSQMRRINNSVHAFIEDTHQVARGEGSMKCRDLYDQYAFHMRDLGRSSSPVSFERFIQMLEDLDLLVEKAKDPLGGEEYIVLGIYKTERLAA
jgi:putative DNA primase/helicase